MNKLFFGVVAFLSIGLTVGQVIIPDRKILAATAEEPVELLTSAACTAADAGKQICNAANPCDAAGVIHCTGEALGLTTINCTASKPNCLNDPNAGSYCSASVNATCPEKVGTFECWSEGLYPDPNNCKRFHYCSADATTGALTPEPHTCPEGSVFDPNAATSFYCVVSNGRNCITVNCTGTTEATGKLMLYPVNRQYIGLCVPKSETEDAKTYVMACPNLTTPNLDNFPPTCPFKCTKTGMFPYSPDKTKFYLCTYVNNVYKSSIESCFSGQVFQTNQCVKA